MYTHIHYACTHIYTTHIHYTTLYYTHIYSTHIHYLPLIVARELVQLMLRGYVQEGRLSRYPARGAEIGVHLEAVTCMGICIVYSICVYSLV